LIKKKKVVAIIPARGGSKSIPQKNIINFCGKPLIAWSIEAAIATTEIDKVIVSTDNEEIAMISLEYGAQVLMRPEHLAQDTSLVIDTMKHVIKTLEEAQNNYDYVVLIEPTSPLRLSVDISKCIQLIDNEMLDSVATFKEADLNPHRAWKIEEGEPKTFIENVVPWLPRQQLPEAYQLNGAVYVNTVKSILASNRELLIGKTGSVIMPKERSVDIDDYTDLIIAERILMKKLEGMEIKNESHFKGTI